MTELHAVLDIEDATERLRELDTLLRTNPHRDLEYKLAGETPMHYAAFFGRAECVKKLFAAGASVDAISDKDGTTPLQIACCYGKLPVVTALLQSGKCDLAIRSGDGFTALHIAVLCQQIECVKLLIANSAPVEVMDHQQENPLHMAIRRGEMEAVKELAKHAKKDARDHLNRGYLHYATMFENLDCIRFFLESNFAENVDQQDSDGWTPLHMAVLLRNDEITNLLKDKGADPKLTNNKGYSADQFAQYERLMEQHSMYVQRVAQQ